MDLGYLSLVAVCLYPLRQGLSGNLKSLVRLGWLANEIQGPTCLPSCLLSTGIIGAAYLTWLFMWVLGSGLRSSCLYGRDIAD